MAAIGVTCLAEFFAPSAKAIADSGIGLQDPSSSESNVSTLPASNPRFTAQGDASGQAGNTRELTDLTKAMEELAAMKASLKAKLANNAAARPQEEYAADIAKLEELKRKLDLALEACRAARQPVSSAPAHDTAVIPVVSAAASPATDDTPAIILPAVSDIPAITLPSAPPADNPPLGTEDLPSALPSQASAVAEPEIKVSAQVVPTNSFFILPSPEPAHSNEPPSQGCRIEPGSSLPETSTAPMPAATATADPMAATPTLPDNIQPAIVAVKQDQSLPPQDRTPSYQGIRLAADQAMELVWQIAARRVDLQADVVIRPDAQPGNRSAARRAARGAEDHAQYSGEWQDGEMSGHGSLTFDDGSQYVGSWKHGAMDGLGQFTMPDGCQYVGEWVEGQIEGDGILKHPDGWKYAGQWHAGRRSGQGCLSYADGWTYTGSWSNGCMHGAGKLVQPDGGTYVGTWKDGKQDGKGTLTYSDGSVYAGFWREGGRTGSGQLMYPDGWKYEGTWTDNKPEGRGTLTHPSGWKYEGEWSQGKFSGRGALARETIPAPLPRWFSTQ